MSAGVKKKGQSIGLQFFRSLVNLANDELYYAYWIYPFSESVGVMFRLFSDYPVHFSQFKKKKLILNSQISFVELFFLLIIR